MEGGIIRSRNACRALLQARAGPELSRVPSMASTASAARSLAAWRRVVPSSRKRSLKCLAAARRLEQFKQGGAKRLRLDLPLHELRHQPLIGQQIGQRHVLHMDEPEQLDQRIAERRNAVGDHHGPIEQHGFQRGRAGSEQDGVGGGHRRVRLAIDEMYGQARRSPAAIARRSGCAMPALPLAR
jgi:hypothetical protein